MDWAIHDISTGSAPPLSALRCLLLRLGIVGATNLDLCDFRIPGMPSDGAQIFLTQHSTDFVIQIYTFVYNNIVSIQI